MIYNNELEGGRAPLDKQTEMTDAYMKYTGEMKKDGAFVGGERLYPTSAATTVRVRDGKRMITDGPFAETREQLGGFYLIECKDLDEAIEWAAKIPGAKIGSIEVRPIVDMAQLYATAPTAAAR